MGWSAGEKRGELGGRGGRWREGQGEDHPAKQHACAQKHTYAHLCVAPSALLYQAPRHRTAHREAPEDAPDEVTEAESYQLLSGQ